MNIIKCTYHINHIIRYVKVKIANISLPFTKQTWHTDFSSKGTLEDDSVEVDSSDIAESETSISIDELALSNMQMFEFFQ